ncbi:hypothetical protein BD770DRAFT_444004 [Pilaira anomala]|nr:hypothetical protein BD770DRAFT_444004 [Pilaira anomala]
MPLQKILAPFLPGTPQRAPNRDGFTLSKEQVLSPSLPFSPPKTNTQYGDPVIGLSTVDEDSSSTGSNDTEPDTDIEKIFENDEQCNLAADTYTSNDEDTLVLHESPTSFDLSDNDAIIESVPKMIEAEYFDQDMMRTSATSLAMHQSPHLKAGIDFTPPSEFMADEESPMLVETSTDMTVPPVSPESDGPKTQPIQEIVKPVPEEFIKSTYTEPVLDIFSSPIAERPSHFAMETSFHKTESDFKLKCMKMIRNAKGLVCKPESPKHLERAKSDTVLQYEKSILSPKVGLHPIDTNLKAVKSVKEEEEKASTPIYKRHQTSQLPLFNSPNAAPTVPYKSPVIGTDAYEIKLLCEQSFFGC